MFTWQKEFHPDQHSSPSNELVSFQGAYQVYVFPLVVIDDVLSCNGHICRVWDHVAANERQFYPMTQCCQDYSLFKVHKRKIKFIIT